MKIVADENIPHLHTFFGELGEIYTLPGRHLRAVDVKDADILIVRSVTRVNEALLSGSKVRFIGTCTIGTDHLDTDYLTRRGIAFASAPGCNAGGVVQYVMAALATVAPDWKTRRVGVVGHGNVGGRLCRTLVGLGVDCVSYDPFLAAESNRLLVAWDELLESDIVCMHTPYTTTGPYPTHHMMNHDALRRLKPGALLINAGRGGAVDNSALLAHLHDGADLRVVLDVWENEPHIYLALAQLVDLGTPHIAGYSYEGKLNGAAMIYEALKRELGSDACEARQRCEAIMQRLKGERQTLSCQAVNPAILSTYDISADYRRFVGALHHAGPTGIGTAFDHFRKTYPERREFDHFHVQYCDSSVYQPLRALGFSVDEQ